MPTKDALLLDRFLSEFVDELIEAYPEEIDWILLAGSAGRGDFRVGESDLDLGIRVKRQEDVEAVKRDALGIFWRLDSKHGMDFGKVYSQKDSDHLASLPSPDGQDKLPFIVRGPQKKPSPAAFPYLIYKRLLYRTLRRNTIRQGRMLYKGSDTLKKLADSEAKMDIFSDIIFEYNFLISLLSLLLFLRMPDKAFKRSVRAVLHSYGDDMGCHFAREASSLKRNSEKAKKEWPLSRKFSYCLKAPFRIMRKNVRGYLSNRKRPHASITQTGKSI